MCVCVCVSLLLSFHNLNILSPKGLEHHRTSTTIFIGDICQVVFSQLLSFEGTDISDTPH